MTNKKVYLDHNATTPVRQEVLDAMMPFYKEDFGNASSLHQFGLCARKAVEDARQKVAASINALPEEIIFTSGGTESDNLAIKGTAFANQSKGNHIITSAVEHHAVLNTCSYLENMGFKVTYLPVDKNGIVSPSKLNEAITSQTILVSIMFANNETGTIEPIAEIGQIAKQKGVLFHTDAVQALGKVPVDVNTLNVDLLSLSGHKVYGPKGVGALYVRKGTRLEPQAHGGHHEGGKRAGTENVPAIVGLGKAVEHACGEIEQETKKLLDLREKLYNGIKQKIEHVMLNGHPQNRLCNTLNISFQYVESEAVILNLDLKGVAVSGGSACTSGTSEPSHVLRAMDIDLVCAQSAVRFSLGRDNTQEDINYVLEVLPDIISRLNAISPIYKTRSTA